MNCEYELSFLCDILKKCHVRTSMLSLSDKCDAMMDPWLSTILGGNLQTDLTVQKLAKTVESRTQYRFNNEWKLRYIFMQLPLLQERNLLCIGPYLSFPLSSKEILEIGEQLAISPNMQKLLKDYYESLPIIPDSDRVLTAIDTFCERIWQVSSFSIVDIDSKHALPPTFPELVAHGDGLDETLAHMKQMELRYAFENELIQAVALGQQHKEQLFLSALDDQLFEKRLQDPVRNAKNYCIIMNTLLRKAAEQGGVHPLYIDRTSSKFAAKIEHVHELQSVSTLMREMFSSYCRLVRRHATQQYSPVVKKTILMIDSDISAELSPGILAEKQGITAGYLATVFKKETNKTVSEYIRDRRISHALHLLNTTNLQIQTVAMHCGIMDVQYFSRIFKKQLGKTPKEYREMLRRKS